MLASRATPLLAGGPFAGPVPEEERGSLDPEHEAALEAAAEAVDAHIRRET